jgi:hypothetical protein
MRISLASLISRGHQLQSVTPNERSSFRHMRLAEPHARSQRSLHVSPSGASLGIDKATETHDAYDVMQGYQGA